MMTEQPASKKARLAPVLLILNVIETSAITKEQALTAIPGDEHQLITVVDAARDLGDNACLKPVAHGVAPNWDLVYDAVLALAKRAANANPVYVTGRAPLPAFAALGHALTISAPVVFLHPENYNSNTLVAMPLMPAAATTTDDKEIFWFVSDCGSKKSLAEGTLAVVVASSPNRGEFTTKDDDVKAFVHQVGESVADVVHVHMSKMSSTNCAALATAIFDLFRTTLHAACPNRTGFALFLSLPGPLAVAVGRAIDVKIHSNIAHVPVFVANAYQSAIALHADRSSASTDWTETALARAQLLIKIKTHIDEFKRELVKTPPTFQSLLSGPEQKRFGDVLSTVAVSATEGASDEFNFSAHERTMTINRGLLHALVKGATEADQVKIGLLVFVHEAFHVLQNVQSTNYHEIGRAGFALEELDYWADAMALGLLCAHDVANGGPRAAGAVNDVASGWIAVALKGIEVFDRISSRDGHIDPFYERRLRRYLIWHLQLARARALPTGLDATSAVACIWSLFGTRLFVEIAPLCSTLDRRFDKQLARKPVMSKTELFVVLDRRVRRFGSNASFNIVDLVENVRTMNFDKVTEAMHYVRNEPAAT